MKNNLVQDAVIRNLQVLAESTQRLSDDFKGKHSNIEWYKIAGMRNILVHDYLGIDLEAVWAVVTSRLPELKPVISPAWSNIPFRWLRSLAFLFIIPLSDS